LADVTKDHKLHHTTTVDKTQVTKDELKKQIKSEKQEQKRGDDFNQVLNDIQEKDYHLKKTDTNESNLAKKSKKELDALIKSEKEAYKTQEAEGRAKVLEDVAKDQKLKKAETVDKSKLPEKAELTAQIKAEKQGKKIDEAQSAVLADLSKGEKKLKKAKTQDKSKVKKTAIGEQIQSEKKCSSP